MGLMVAKTISAIPIHRNTAHRYLGAIRSSIYDQAHANTSREVKAMIMLLRQYSIIIRF